MSDTLTTWNNRLRARLGLEDAARREHVRRPTVKTRTKLALRKSQVAFARRVIARHAPLSEVIAFDGCPVPRGLAIALGDARHHGWQGVVVSCDRRQGVAERFGKSSQAKLWNGWMRRLPGFNPANPPGFSSHERRSDGSSSLAILGDAYKKPRGSALAWWQTGIDASEAPGLVSRLNSLGYGASQPYSSPSEAHHINFKRDPTSNLKRRKLR